MGEGPYLIMSKSDPFSALWTERYRPKTLDEIILSEANRTYFASVKEIPNLLFSGPSGCGKTSLAKILVNDVLKCQYLYMNASDERSIDDIRNKVTSFAQTKSVDGKIKVIILDEIDGMLPASQRALRGVMEEYSEVTRFVLTCNHPHRLLDAIKSRCQSFDLSVTIDQFVERCAFVLKSEKVKAVSSAKLLKFLKHVYPDMRLAINFMQKYSTGGVLTLPDDALGLGVAQRIYKSLVAHDSVLDLREYVIEHEPEFNRDYHGLLVDLFEQVYSGDLELGKKRDALIILSEALYRQNIVMDYEINLYATLLELSKII